MIFIAIGLILLIYSGFVSLSVTLQVMNQIANGKPLEFSYTKAMLVAVLGTSLACYGVSAL